MRASLRRARSWRSRVAPESRRRANGTATSTSSARCSTPATSCSSTPAALAARAPSTVRRSSTVWARSSPLSPPAVRNWAARSPTTAHRQWRMTSTPFAAHSASTASTCWAPPTAGSSPRSTRSVIRRTCERSRWMLPAIRPAATSGRSARCIRCCGPSSLICERSPSCNPDTPDPIGQIAWLAKALRAHPLVGNAYDAGGQLHHVVLDETKLIAQRARQQRWRVPLPGRDRGGRCLAACGRPRSAAADRGPGRLPCVLRLGRSGVLLQRAERGRLLRRMARPVESERHTGGARGAVPPGAASPARRARWRRSPAMRGRHSWASARPATSARRGRPRSSPRRPPAPGSSTPPPRPSSSAASTTCRSRTSRHRPWRRASPAASSSCSRRPATPPCRRTDARRGWSPSSSRAQGPWTRAARRRSLPAMRSGGFP